MSRNLPLAETDALRMHRTRKVRTSAVKLKNPVVKCCSSVQPDSMKGHLEVGKIGEGGKEAAPHVQIRALLQHQFLQIVVQKPKEAGHAISAQGKPNVMTSSLAAWRIKLLCSQQHNNTSVSHTFTLKRSCTEAALPHRTCDLCHRAHPMAALLCPDADALQGTLPLYSMCNLHRRGTHPACLGLPQPPAVPTNGPLGHSSPCPECMRRGSLGHPA